MHTNNDKTARQGSSTIRMETKHPFRSFRYASIHVPFMKMLNSIPKNYLA